MCQLVGIEVLKSEDGRAHILKMAIVAAISIAKMTMSRET